MRNPGKIFLQDKMSMEKTNRDNNTRGSEGDGLTNVNRSLLAVAQWLRCCATNRKVAGSIPDGAVGIFH